MPHQSSSPLISALATVATSGLIDHSTRSMCTTLPPAVRSARLVARHVAGKLLIDHPRARHPLVGLEAERPAARRVGDRHSRHRWRRGAPASPGTCWASSARAHPAAAGTAPSGGNAGCGRRAAEISSTAAISDWPKASRLPQRRTEAAASRASTRSPSWNFRPSRKRHLPGQRRRSRRRGLPPSAAAPGRRRPGHRACRRS